MKTLKIFMILCFGLLLLSTHTNALDINPLNATVEDPGGINNNGTSSILEYLADYYDLGSDLYKYEESGGFWNESGLLQGSYDVTNVFLEDGEPTGFDIVYEGAPAPIAGNPTYLLVKDGDADPGWYFYDLYDLGWDGEDVLELRNFWAGVGVKGSISHVSLHGPAPVPEPATLLLLGTGLVGLAATGRKKFKK